MNRILTHLDDNRPIYVVAAVVLATVVGVLWYSLGPVTAGYAHFEF